VIQVRNAPVQPENEYFRLIEIWRLLQVPYRHGLQNVDNRLWKLRQSSISVPRGLTKPSPCQPKSESDSDEQPVRNDDHDLLVRIMTSVLPYVSDDFHYSDKELHWKAYLDYDAEAAVIYDMNNPDGSKRSNATDFYARVEVGGGRTTVIVDWFFVPPELLVVKDRHTMIKVRDPRDPQVRDELHYTRGPCHWSEKEDTGLRPR
jgi:hypothetical protein